MPNWCFTSYVVTGEEKEVCDLYEKMLSLEEREESLVENGFGKSWLGNLVTLLGGDWNTIYSRGAWLDLQKMKTMEHCALTPKLRGMTLTRLLPSCKRSIRALSSTSLPRSREWDIMPPMTLTENTFLSDTPSLPTIVARSISTKRAKSRSSSRRLKTSRATR